MLLWGGLLLCLLLRRVRLLLVLALPLHKRQWRCWCRLLPLPPPLKPPCAIDRQVYRHVRSRQSECCWLRWWRLSRRKPSRLCQVSCCVMLHLLAWSWLAIGEEGLEQREAGLRSCTLRLG